jgi:uncharacterized membrane protein YphA (DoxX/SURF4 family)
MKRWVFAARIFTGLVFIFAGFVKAVDPAGYAIKFDEYFMAFHLDFLMILSMPLSFLISASELAIGINLLAGIKPRFTILVLLIFMLFFTALTLILAVFEPVTDCGCFGDAIKLSNWQTFLKNIVLLFPTLLLFVHRNTIQAFTNKSRIVWMLVVANLSVGLLISLYGIRHEPLLDFRPYKVGTYIPDKMIIPDGAPADQFQTILVYERRGIRQEFKINNYPWQDTSWKWVETRQKLLKKGYEPPIHDFAITNEEKEDITDNLLTANDYTFLIIIPSLPDASHRSLDKLNSLALKARETGFAVYGITSSTEEETGSFRQTYQPAFPICTADETMLKTMMRSQAGLLILREGTILGKWNYRDAPSPNEIDKNLIGFLLKKQQRKCNVYAVIILSLLIVLAYCFAYTLRK